MTGHRLVADDAEACAEKIDILGFEMELGIGEEVEALAGTYETARRGTIKIAVDKSSKAACCISKDALAKLDTNEDRIAPLCILKCAAYKRTVFDGAADEIGVVEGRLLECTIAKRCFGKFRVLEDGLRDAPSFDSATVKDRLEEVIVASFQSVKVSSRKIGSSHV